ncbi:MAG: transposase [Deltaproteobacteria bacterium]|nr:transposase [Deltaproteobacteria bacterium]
MTDMWECCHQDARSRLPQTEVVFGRFHVMQHLNIRLTQLRTAFQKKSAIARASSRRQSPSWIIFTVMCADPLESVCYGSSR